MKDISYISRREIITFLATLGLLPNSNEGSSPVDTGKILNSDRLEKAYEARLKAAKFEKDTGSVSHKTNGDESTYENKIGSFSKGLPHNSNGEVDRKAFAFFVKALESRDLYQLERIPLGGYSKLSNPQAAWAFELIGPDCSQLELPPPPFFNSPHQAAEMCELYWQAITADISFSEYESSLTILRACEDLSRLSDFRGPKDEERITQDTIFRGSMSGCLKGPYVSQFLWRDIPLSPIRAPQKMRTTVPSVSYLTSYDDWLRIQNGSLAGVNQFDSESRFIRNGRDLAEYVHRDFTYQAFVCAALMLFNMGADSRWRESVQILQNTVRVCYVRTSIRVSIDSAGNKRCLKGSLVSKMAGSSKIASGRICGPSSLPQDEEYKLSNSSRHSGFAGLGSYFPK